MHWVRPLGPGYHDHVSCLQSLVVLLHEGLLEVVRPLTYESNTPGTYHTYDGSCGVRPLRHNPGVDDLWVLRVYLLQDRSPRVQEDRWSDPSTVHCDLTETVLLARHPVRGDLQKDHEQAYETLLRLQELA